MAPIYLRQFLLSIFGSYKDENILKLIWRYLNSFRDPQTMVLMRDILTLGCVSFYLAVSDRKLIISSVAETLDTDGSSGYNVRVP